MIAGTDCGLAGRVGHPEIVWAKLEDLAAGARLASRAMGGRSLSHSVIRFLMKNPDVECYPARSRRSGRINALRRRAGPGKRGHAPH